MTTSSSDIMKLFKSRVDNPIYNTSYPLSPHDWAKYAADGILHFDCDRPIAFYIHIPFCKQICSFCEYSKMVLPSSEWQRTYLKTLRSDIENFISSHASTLYGFDIGGGTPTALEPSVFEELIGIYKEVFLTTIQTDDFEPSIEGTFETLTPEKVRIIAEADIHRLSLGLQSSCASILTPLHRRVADFDKMRDVIDLSYEAGIKKVNLDLMYGLPNQSLESIRADIKTVEALRPEQVTLYELRTNQINGDYHINFELCYESYCSLFDGLIGLGYHGRFGQNTFSVDDKDKGLSSYLRHRMFDGWQYKGFGISAQSMSAAGLSYNIGKNGNIKNMISSDSFEFSQYYKLPPKELFAKFIAISGYSGGFSIESATRIYGNSFERVFQQIISSLVTEGLMKISGDRIQITRSGYRHYGALLSLFSIDA